MAAPALQRNTQTAFHTQRNRNRPTNLSLQLPHVNLPSNTKRNRYAKRRSMATQMERHRPRKQHRENHPRKRQQPPHRALKQKTHRHAQRITQKLPRQSILKPRTTPRLLPRQLLPTKKKNRQQTPKPKTPKNNIPHPQKMERNHRIPPNQKHPPRHATIRPQKHKKHPPIRQSRRRTL